MNRLAGTAHCLICRRRIWPWQRVRYSAVLHRPMHRDCAGNLENIGRWQEPDPEEETWTGV